MNPIRSSSFHKAALALVALALVVPGAAWSQPTPGQYVGSFSNDGIRQTAAGGWVMPYDECSWDVGGLGAFVTEATCEAAGGSWDPEALTGSLCYYNRPECLKNIFYGVPVTAGAPPIDLYPGALDSKAECESWGHEWRSSSTSGACTDGESRSQSSCEDAGYLWYGPACRAKFTWITFAYTYDDATLSNYNDCARCHNTRHYPKADELHHYHGSERSVAETYALTGHKNMQRPVARDGDDPHYLAFSPWLDKAGEEIEQDIFGNILHFATGETETSPGVFADLWYLRDWIAEYPEPVYTGGENDGCARCHSTGFDAAYVETTVPPTKQPYIMFPDFPVDQATGGWDQWGIQCSRCHGSQLINDADGFSPNKGDMRHHPNLANNKAAIDSGYPNEARCAADGFTWGAFGVDDDEFCYDPAILSEGACDDAAGDWEVDYSICTFELLASGATRTNICADCHISGTVTTQPVGSQHGLELDFRGHFHANQFLNSPHARFLGNGTQIGDKTQYDTHFQFEGESYPYDNTVRNKGLQGGCTQCHDVHKSSLAEANPDGGYIHEECTECHAKNLAVMLHPAGKDTPMEEPTNPNHACEVCHMPKTEDGRALHFFRVSVEPTYEMFPSTMFDLPQANKFANALDDDGYAQAVWVDLDHACGQCHGGGTEFKMVAGDVTSGSNVVTNVADTTGFAKGERIFIAGAGEAGGDLHSWVSSVGPDSITLVTIPMPGTSMVGATVEQNPPAAGIGYINKVNLAAYAKGIHNDAPKVNFTYTLDGADTLTAIFNANATTCNGSIANCNLFAWDFGDGQSGSGIMPAHTYAAPGNYTVTLTVTQYGMQSGSKSKVVTTYMPDYPPTVESTCDWDADTWTMTLTDASTDDHGIQQVAITWGDGSLTTVGAQGGVFVHTYTKTGTFTVTEKVADTVGQLATFVCNPAPTASYFNIAGKVTQSNGTTPLSNVKVQVFKNGTTLVKTVYSNISGDYVAGTLKPGSYSMTFSRNGYVFDPVGLFDVGPSAVVDKSANP